MKYFQAIVRCQSFTKAADECYISQSAISQQIQALEKELGVKLIIREGRKISLTPAGEYFYKKSLVLISDFDRLCAATKTFGKGVEQELVIGYLRHYDCAKLEKSVAEFKSKYPEVSIKFLIGTHEELYDYLRGGKADVVINDLRRKPSDQYVNFFLTKSYFFAELSNKNPLSQLETLTTDDLKNTPLIIIAPEGQRNDEELFFREYLGVKGEFIFAENLQAAHLTVIADEGCFITDFYDSPDVSPTVNYVPLIYNRNQMYRKYYAFWRTSSSNKYIEDFAEILKKNL